MSSSVRDHFSRQKVEDYKRRGAEARHRAEAEADPEARRLLLQTADTFDRMAAWEEEHPGS